MSIKFKDVPIDLDTKIIFRQEIKVEKYDCLHEVWSWDSIIAESFIFDNKDIKGLSDDELKRMVKSSEIFKIGSDVLVKRSGTGYTFVNYINKLS